MAFGVKGRRTTAIQSRNGAHGRIRTDRLTAFEAADFTDLSTRARWCPATDSNREPSASKADASTNCASGAFGG